MIVLSVSESCCDVGVGRLSQAEQISDVLRPAVRVFTVTTAPRSQVGAAQLQCSTSVLWCDMIQMIPIIIAFILLPTTSSSSSSSMIVANNSSSNSRALIMEGDTVR